MAASAGESPLPTMPELYRWLHEDVNSPTMGRPKSMLGQETPTLQRKDDRLRLPVIMTMGKGRGAQANQQVTCLSARPAAAPGFYASPRLLSLPQQFSTLLDILLRHDLLSPTMG